eukprot:scaffold8978_cov140-Skeletonema_marinoi.AAC.11
MADGGMTLPSKNTYSDRGLLSFVAIKRRCSPPIGLQEMAREGLENVECVTNICTHGEHCYPGDLI